MITMTLDSLDFDPNRLAAVIYRPEDDVDALLADFANDLLRAGERVGGIVQRNFKDDSGRRIGMEVIDLMTGREIGICQTLGSGSLACKLDASGLAESSLAIGNAIANDVDLIVVNKFSKQEASGRGLRSEVADAIMAGHAVLTAVPEKCVEAWKEFTGDRGTTLLSARRVVDGWWQEVSRRDAIVRGIKPWQRATGPGSLEITSRS
jgi:molybdate transport system ATP-binding protein